MSAGAAGSGTALLRRLRTPAAAPHDACALCGVRLSSEHRHLADIERRALACCCGACAMLFDRPGAAGGRFRSLPNRVLVDPGHRLDAAVWAALGIPVGTAFVLRDAAQDRAALFYPSPAGATESQADDDAWRNLRQATRLAGLLEPAVEALLLRRDGDRVDCYLVPVDACYELVGRMRLHWHGFDGGSVARSELDAFFGRLADRARPLAARESA